MEGRDERLTAVVLTHNRRIEVLHTVDRLLSLPEQPSIIVVDNGSRDGTADALAASFPEVSIIRFDRNIGAAARNAGILCARTPYVALCDDDTWWEAGSLARGAILLDQFSRLAVLTGRVLVGSNSQVDATSRLMAHSLLPREAGTPGIAVLGFLAGASLIRRSAFLAVGGFEPRFFIGGEETLVALDLASSGWRMAYREDLVVHHYPSAVRDSGARRSLLLRNAIWVAWLRRPLASAVRQTIRLVIDSVRPADAASFLKETIAGLPWVLRRRRVIPPEVEAQLQQLGT
jgi:GT2 family glycosyltransferase